MHLGLMKQLNGEHWHGRQRELTARESTAPQQLQIIVTVSVMRSLGMFFSVHIFPSAKFSGSNIG